MRSCTKEFFLVSLIREIRYLNDADLDTIATVHLCLALVVFPDDTELNDSFRDLNDGESFSVERVLF